MVAAKAAAAELNDQQKYKSFFRTLPQYEFLPQALIQTAVTFRWTQIAVITQTEHLDMTHACIRTSYSVTPASIDCCFSACSLYAHSTSGGY